MVFDFVTHRRHRLVEDSLDERHAASASGASFGARLDIADRLAGAVFHAVNDIAFRDVVT